MKNLFLLLAGCQILMSASSAALGKEVTIWSAQSRQCQPDSNASNDLIYGGWVFRPGRTRTARLVCPVTRLDFFPNTGIDSVGFSATVKDTDGIGTSASIEVCLMRKNHMTARSEKLSCVFSNDNSSRGVVQLEADHLNLGSMNQWAHYFTVRMSRNGTAEQVNLHSLRIWLKG